MNEIKKYTKPFIFLIVVSCFFFSSCENEVNKVQQTKWSGAGKEEAHDVVINYSVGPNRKSKITAPLMYRVQDTVIYTEFPHTIHVDFFGGGDSLQSKLDAHYAKYKQMESIVFLKDSVRVINVTGDTLYCDELYWDRNRVGDEFYTDKPVRIRTKTHTINGIGMDAGEDFKAWHIVQPTGPIKVPSSQMP
jgi:lipopolysaccharide export system protein LptC